MSATKHLFAYVALGGISVLGISFFNGGFVDNRPLGSYLLPLFVGALGGTIAGLLSHRLKQQQQEREALFLAIIEALATTLEERDSYTHGHAQRVTSLAVALGEQIALNKHELHELHLASVLHDIGKIGIPDEILLKTDRLTDEEFSIIQAHPGKGARILRLLSDPRIDCVIDGVRHHHERFGGGGYPDGLTGEAIPRLARIISIADSYDAMTSDRPYRQGMSRDQALEIISRCSGSQFDPQFAAVFVGMLKQHPEHIPLQGNY